jgi:hypothetical protein
MTKAAATAVLAGLVMVGLAVLAHPAAAQPAGDGPCGGCGAPPPADITPEAVIARAEAQMNEVNSLARRVETCTGNDDDSDLVIQGTVRWRLTAVSQEAWREMGSITTGLMYRKECWVPEAGEFGALIDLAEFDALTPENMAAVAIRRAIEAIPTQTVASNPASPSLVTLDTWFWVTGVPPDGVTAVAEVPGIRVVAHAGPGGTEFDFGDGNSLRCTGAGAEWAPARSSGCTHTYVRADEYTVTSTVLWTGSYSINGGASIPFDSAVARVSPPYPLQVNEAEGIVIR